VWVGDIQATEEADRKGGQSRSQKMGAYWTVEEVIGGGKVTGSGGKAGSEADRAGEGSTAYIGGIGGVGQMRDQVTQLLKAAVVAAGDVADSAGEGSKADIGGVGGVGQMEVQVTQFLEVAGVVARAAAGDMSSLGNEGGTELVGDATEKADRTGGHPGDT
jgi:D-arabinose 1-dehydrogenase-like Zn-dependent alcohol dehydrogenase